MPRNRNNRINSLSSISTGIRSSGIPRSPRDHYDT